MKRLIFLAGILYLVVAPAKGFLFAAVPSLRPKICVTNFRIPMNQQLRRGTSTFMLSETGDSKASGGPDVIFDALMNGDTEGVLEYVARGGDCMVQDSIGDTPLMLAIENDMSSVISTLVQDGGADVNHASHATGETPLMLAAYYGYTHLVMTLVEKCGADIDAVNKRGDTALNLACFWGNVDTVKYLLGAGADPDVTNDLGKRAGDGFDTVFVSGAGPAEPGTRSGVHATQEGEEGEEIPTTRRIIENLLEEARGAVTGGGKEGGVPAGEGVVSGREAGKIEPQ